MITTILHTSLFAQNVTVAGAVAGNGTYPDLGSAFSAINLNPQTGAIIIVSITGNTTEPVTATLNQGDWTYLTIRPFGGAARTISGAIAGNLVELNGADRVLIDGLNTGGNSLTISNTSTGTASSLRFFNDARVNGVQNCSILGSNTSATSGTVLFGTGSAIGNDSIGFNTVNIDAAGTNLPINGVYSAGSPTAGQENDHVTFNACNISNFFNAGVVSAGILAAAGNSEWTISNCRLFQAATRTATTSLTHRAIQILSGDNHQITSNTIGFANVGGTGTYTISGAVAVRFVCIELSAGTTVPSSIQGNTISGFGLSTTSGAATTTGVLCGISVLAGNVNIGNITPNTIGGSTGVNLFSAVPTTSGGAVVGIHNGSSGTVLIQNNIMGGFSCTGITAAVSGGIVGISTSGTPGTLNILGNTIGNTTADNMRGGTSGFTTGSGVVLGISLAALPAQCTVATNTIRNLSSFGTGSTSAVRGIQTVALSASSSPLFMNANSISNLTTASASATYANGQTAAQGIAISGGLNNIVTSNIITNINATNTGTAGVAVCGIGCGNATNTIINGNLITGLSNASTSVSTIIPATVVGVLVRSGTTAVTVRNNMISISGGVGVAPIGIMLNHGSTPNPVDNIYNNTIHIFGTLAATGQPSFGILRGDFSATARTMTVDIRNNLVNNIRTGPSANNYAIGNNFGATVSAIGWPANASNNNILNSDPNTIGHWGVNQTFAGWKAASASDGLSYSGAAVTFVNPVSNLHINMGTTPNLLESNGAAIASVLTDIDGDVRPGPAGSVNGGAFSHDIGADEFDGVILDALAPQLIYTPLTFTCALSDRTISATIIDFSGVPNSGNVPRIYYRRNSDPWQSAPGSFVSGSATNGTWSFTISSAAMPGLSTGDNVSYYIIAQDIVTPTPNIGSNPALGLVATSVTNVTTPPTTPNTYQIAGNLAGTFTVGAAGNYTTLTAAVAAYNTSCLTGPVVFNLIDNSYSGSETFPITILPNSFSSITNSLTIKPTLAATTISGSSATAILKLDGADFVTIDGSISNTANNCCAPAVSASRDLTISNTNTNAGTATVWLASQGAAAGASTNTLKNCNIANGIDQSTTTAENFAVLLSGPILSVPPSEGLDNNENTFENNAITKAGWGIYLRGSNATPNSGNQIRQNLIGPAAFGVDQIRKAGIAVQDQANGQITCNEVRFVGNVNAQVASGTDHIGIAIGGTEGPTPANSSKISGYLVSRNQVHDIVCEKTFSAVGIMLSTENTVANANLISNNMINDIRANGTAGDQGIGIAIARSNGDQVVNNTINMVSPDRDPSGTTTSTESSIGVRVQSNALNLTLANNIIHVDQASNTLSLLNFALVVPSAAYAWGTGFCDYNDYSVLASNPQSALFGLGNAGAAIPATASLGAWQGTFSPNQDANSVTVTPVFVSATDLHLNQGSNNALSNLGMPIAAVTEDIDCGLRDGSAPDMGADEFEPLCITATAGVVLPGDTSNCGPISLTLSASAYSIGVGSAYVWESSPFGLGTFTPTGGINPDNYPSGTINTPTDFRLMVTCATDASTAYTDVMTIYAGDSTAPVAVCQAVTVTLDAAGNAFVAANSFDNGSSDNCSPSAALAFSASLDSLDCSNVGINNVTLVVTDTSGNTSNCVAALEVNASPMVSTVSPVVLANGNNISCLGGNDGAATASASSGCPIYSYLWSNGQTTATATGLSAGAYSVIVSDGSGQIDTLSVTLTEPAAALSGSTLTTIESCVPGGDGSIDLTPAGGSPGYTFFWSGTETTEDISGLPAGNYSVTITDIVGCTAIVNATVQAAVPPATPVILQTGNVLSSSLVAASYQWNLAGNAIPGATTQAYTPVVDGIYTVTIFDSNGCSATSAPFIFTNVASGDLGGIRLWPNPAQGMVSIQVQSQDATACSIRISDMHGRVLVSQQNVDLHARQDISLAGFAAGVYTVEIQSGDRRNTAKLVVQ